VFELLHLGGDRKRISVVPCGVDLTTFRSDVEAEPRSPGLRRIVCVGRLVERKGVGNAIEALGRMRAGGGPDTELVVAGGPDVTELDGDPEVERLRTVARHAGVADRVVFRGRVGRAARPRCSARRTSRSASRGTSRSASSRWRRWPAASPSSPPRWAA
jgi:glycosyltransferase involved in cell wall biosynthesis